MHVGSAMSPSLVMLFLGALLAGCGGGETTVEFTRAGPAAPKECVERYNGSAAARALGTHAHSRDHGSRAAHVYRITDEGSGLRESCAVIFAASESDSEFGVLGAVEHADGWDFTTRLSLTPDRREQIQRLGARQANVAVASDGRLTPL